MSDRPAPYPVDVITNARMRLLIEARNMVIASDPNLSARYRRAHDQLDDDDPAVREAAIQEASAVLHEATEAVGGQPQQYRRADHRRHPLAAHPLAP